MRLSETASKRVQPKRRSAMRGSAIGCLRRQPAACIQHSAKEGHERVAIKQIRMARRKPRDHAESAGRLAKAQEIPPPHFDRRLPFSLTAALSQPRHQCSANRLKRSRSPGS